jgi:hypothetical protein
MPAHLRGNEEDLKEWNYHFSGKILDFHSILGEAEKNHA